MKCEVPDYKPYFFKQKSTDDIFKVLFYNELKKWRKNAPSLFCKLLY